MPSHTDAATLPDAETASRTTLDAPQHAPAAPWAKPVRPWNPLHDDLRAARASSYLGHTGQEGLRHLLQSDRACSEAETAAHAHVQAHILGEGFPCVAARSVLNRATYRMGVYGELGMHDAAIALCHDLYEFSHEFGPDATSASRFASFFAVFQGTCIESELAFEQKLWQQLQAMHRIDARHFEWNGDVSKDPDSPDFSFSLGGRAFFVVGLNSHASRLSRRTDWPCLVFNPHEQFDALRAAGKYDPLRDAIRERDLAFQGFLNPMLSNFGDQPESRQYAGRALPAHWTCPFHTEP